MRLALLIIVVIMVGGVVGYMSLEHYNLIDALFMTVITVSTVGYREVHDLSPEGKTFTIILILFSWSSFAFALSMITTYFVEGELMRTFRIFRGKSGVKKMENHVIVVGFGRNGRQCCHELKANRYPFVVVEKDHELILSKTDRNIIFVEGDATEDETLINAGIRHAKALITTLPIDADNLFVCLTARALRPELILVSRASNDSTEDKLHRAGVDRVVMPEKVGGEHMASLVMRPDVLEFLNHISVQGSSEANLEELTCSNMPDEFINLNIEDLDIRKKTGANIIGFKTLDGEFMVNPSADTKLKPNSKLFVLGTPEQIRSVKDLLRKKK